MYSCNNTSSGLDTCKYVKDFVIVLVLYSSTTSSRLQYRTQCHTTLSLKLNASLSGQWSRGVENRARRFTTAGPVSNKTDAHTSSQQYLRILSRHEAQRAIYFATLFSVSLCIFLYPVVYMRSSAGVNICLWYIAIRLNSPPK